MAKLRLKEASTTMLETAQKLQKSEGGLLLPNAPESIGFGTSSGFDKDSADRTAYNESVPTLDSGYMAFEPYRKILVRCYVHAYYESGGVLIKPSVIVEVPTQSGYGYLPHEESPYPYSTRAVIVSAPKGKEAEGFTPGREVLLLPKTVMAFKAGKDYPFHMPRAFMLPEWQSTEPPTSIKDRHYGYLLVDPMVDVQGFLS